MDEYDTLSPEVSDEEEDLRSQRPWSFLWNRPKNLTLCRHMDLSEREYQRKYPLIAAAHTGDMDAVQAMLKAGCNINQTDPFQKTALQRLVESYHSVGEEKTLPILKTLLKHSADPTLCDYRGTHLLTRAVCSLPSDTFQLIYNQCEKFWKSPVEKNSQLVDVLMTCVQCDLPDQLEFLLSHLNSDNHNACDPTQLQSNMYRLLLMSTLRESKKPRILEIILKNSSRQNLYEHMLKIAIQNTTDWSVKMIVFELANHVKQNPGFDVISEVSSGFYKAAVFGTERVAMTLVQAGWCDVPHQPGDIEPPHYVAFTCKKLTVIKAILAAGYPLQLPTAIDLIESLMLQNHQESKEWLKEVASTPISLKVICRTVIRKAIGLSLVVNVQMLPLPSLMKGYLLIKEINGLLK